MRKVPPHRIGIIEKLERTYKPFATRVSEYLGRAESDIHVENLMADTIIEMEKLIEEQQNEILRLRQEQKIVLHVKE